MSNTPRTDLNMLTIETIRTLPGSGVRIVLAAVMQQMERELNEANKRIEALIKAGDGLSHCIGCGCGISGPCNSCATEANTWNNTVDGSIK
jgi:recombinational DNA repair protein RecR